jgi:defect-in-organelle-trafficking protein DotD
MFIRIVWILFISLGLIGCRKTIETRTTPDLPDLSRVEMSEAAIGVDESLSNLAAVMAEREPIRVEPRSIEEMDFGMYQLASVDWAGPAEPLIERLAQVENYHVRVLGRAPHSGALVQISKRETPVGEILRDVALQIQQDADVIVFPQDKLIEIRYRNDMVYHIQ